jgi:hypothetical protein
MSTPEVDPFASVEISDAPESEVAVSAIPASVVKMAQASLDQGKRKEAKLPTAEKALELKALLSNAGRATSPQATVRPTISANDPTVVMWRTFIRAERKPATPKAAAAK